MDRTAVVVLNYLNYKDTKECVDSILEIQQPVCGVIIVDNGSRNGSYAKLKKEYKNIDQVYLIACKKNQGYARGNNIGIRFARKKLQADFVLVVNNDTIFVDKDYIKKLWNAYRPGIGVIGSRIILRDGQEQPRMAVYADLRNSAARYLNRLSAQMGSSFDFPADKGTPRAVLHGCALMFTPDFFRSYQGFYKRTFLYEEEMILYLMCRCRRLEQRYVPEAEIYHKEDQSSLLSFQNDRSVIRRYLLQSEKYVVWWGLKYEIRRLFGKWI